MHRLEAYIRNGIILILYLFGSSMRRPLRPMSAHVKNQLRQAKGNTLKKTRRYYWDKNLVTYLLERGCIFNAPIEVRKSRAHASDPTLKNKYEN